LIGPHAIGGWTADGSVCKKKSYGLAALGAQRRGGRLYYFRKMPPASRKSPQFDRGLGRTCHSLILIGDKGDGLDTAVGCRKARGARGLHPGPGPWCRRSTIPQRLITGFELAAASLRPRSVPWQRQHDASAWGPNDPADAPDAEARRSRGLLRTVPPLAGGLLMLFRTAEASRSLHVCAIFTGESS